MALLVRGVSGFCDLFVSLPVRREVRGASRSRSPRRRSRSPRRDVVRAAYSFACIPGLFALQRVGFLHGTELTIPSHIRSCIDIIDII